MINRNIHNKPAVDPSGGSDTADYAEKGYPSDLSQAPGANLPTDPLDNSTAMLGYSPDDEVGEGVNPSEAGPTGATLAGMGMMVQGAQIVALYVPGFVPMEVTSWLQNAMKTLPQILQQMNQGLGAASSGAGLGAGMLAPSGQGGGMPGAPPSAPPPSPSGPPQRPY